MYLILLTIVVIIIIPSPLAQHVKFEHGEGDIYEMKT